MKYLVIEIQNNADGTLGNIVNAYDNRPDAEEQYHTVLKAAAKSAVLVHACAMLNQNGEEIKSEHYVHPAPEE